MRRGKRLLALCMAALIMIFAAAAAESGTDAEAVAEALAQGRYADVCAMMDETMAENITPEGLEKGWETVVGLLGDMRQIASVEVSEKDGMTVARVTCLHENGAQVTTVTTDAEGRIAGLSIAPAAQSAEDVEIPEGVTVEKTTLCPDGLYETNAERVFPEGEGPFVAVVMAQGSGASDMNESILGNAPFRDLAYGLAQRGVASLRYDKYTYVHTDRIGADFTVYDETVRDAVAACRMLLADARVSKVYLLGHSQGAMLAPRILREADGLFSGAVLMAGSPYPLWRIQYAQNLALADKLEGEQKDATLLMIQAEADKLDGLRGLTDEEKQKETFFGISAWYQLDEMSVDAAETAREVGLPLLIVQGGKDWQVTRDMGIDAWREALGEDGIARYAFYPSLNHLFMAQEGEPAGDTTDYATPGHVADEAIDDIAAFLLGQ